ncbi:DUF1800 family protein [Erythrobacter sp. THAF29]|uniref:DUF1800 domain-containing protein n=1 Tax=Erythrobacter sp. THAF29 TaxID=2587851 RepID=UPI00126889E4|nr:DUF1800 domain-containing protein [Erythrobacter sp. THAF29]QFT77602.1 hypothetical protein FIU90_08630 [Erythrobacter sp. THAF29]
MTFSDTGAAQKRRSELAGSKPDRGEFEKSSAHVKPSSSDEGSAIAARAVGVSALAVATAACGGGGGSGGAPPTGGGGTPAPSPTPVVVKPADDAAAARFLLQASFAASTGAISQLRNEGYEPWLDRQMSASNSQSARQFFASRGYDQVDTNRHYNSSRTGDYMIWSQLLTEGNSLRKRFALALSEFFVVSLNSINLTWRSPAIGEYWDILNRNAFGSYRTLIEEITLNPAMGVFLNTRGNRKADPNTGRVPDENYGREIMQLFSIGLFELNPDGTRRLSGGNPIETYDNNDVTGIAKVFTGYDYDYTGIGFTTEIGSTRQIPDAAYARNPMTADPSRWRFPRSTGFHSDDEKSFLGLTIPAGTNAADSLKMALDHLTDHPNVGPFFAKQMIQRLVTSNPSPTYVQRVASVFANNGRGQRGDLGAVFKAILLDDEALDPANASNPEFGKLREPMLRFIQLGRTFGASSSSGNWEIRNLSDPATYLGQSPLRSPSVFNFFRPGYIPSGTQTADRGLVAPEFQLVNETSVAGYVNFVERAVDTSVWYLDDLELDYTAEIALADDAPALLDRLDLILTANQLGQTTRDTILSAMQSVNVTASSSQEDKLRRVHIGVALIMSSTDYLVQK